MGTFLESTKVFNELRNGSDFSLNPTKFTTVLKANVGEKIKIVSKFRVFWNVFATPTNLDTFTVAVVDGGHSITSAIGQNFETFGFKVGDTFTFIDNEGGGIGTAPGQVITLISGAYMEITINAPLVPNDYTDAIMHGTNQLDNLIYDFNLTANSDSQNLVNDIFNLVQSYEFSGLEIEGADVTGVAKLPIFWESGSAIARQLATVNTFEQVYEVEVILTVPYYKEGQLSNLEEALKPFPFNVETQFYKENVTLGVGSDTSTNRKFDISRALNDSIGYYNENFDGGVRQYSIVSVAYEEKTSGDSREVPEITETTKVTVVMASNNTTMAATDPAVISFSYLPTSDDYLSGDDDFNDTWNYDSLRGLLDGSVVAGTNIIKNLDLDVDNPNQITFTFDLGFSQVQQDRMFPSGNFILAIENEDPALAVESSNRLNLIIDVNVFTKNTDISGLLAVIKDEVYYHNDVFIDGVTSGTTDLQAWNETYIMRDIRFKLITDTVLVEIDRMFAEVIMFNPSNGDFFIIQSVEIPSVTQAVTINGGKKIQNINLNGIRGFLIPDDSQFNKLVVVTDTFSDPDQFYKIQVGVMLNWETWEALLTDPSFFDANKPNNNQNKKTSNYSDLNGFEIRLAMLYQVKKNNIITDYHAIQDNGAVFDYDLDKNGSPKFTTTHVYEDVNDVVLPLKLVIGEDNEVIVTNDDGLTKVSADDFNGQIRLEVFEQGNEKSIHIISSIDGVIAGDILKPLDGETLMNRSLVADNYTSKCLIDGVQLGLKQYSISSEIQERILAPFNEFSMLFDGVNEFFNAGTTSSFSFLQNTGIFTISVWMKFTDFTLGNNAWFMGNQSGANINKGIQFGWLHTNDTFFVRLTKGVGGTPIISSETTTSIITDNNWHHVVARGDGTNVFFNIDNVKQTGSDTMGSKSTGNSQNVLGIGRINTLVSDGWNGNLDEISIWDSFLSDADVTLIYNSACPNDLNSHPAAAADLVSWWRMGEGATFDGSNWTVPDEKGSNTAVSVAMEEADREIDTIC